MLKNHKFTQIFIYLFVITGTYFVIETIISNRLLSEYDSICRQFGEYTTIIIRNDDISALSNLDHEKRIFSIFQKYSVPQIIGVIPYVSENCSTCINQNFHDIRSATEIITYFVALRNIGLVEIGQHGYRHCSNYLHNMAYNGLSEFSDLPYSEQYEKILLGKTILEAALGQEITIFLPPFNRYDKVTVNVLEDLGFKILSGGKGSHRSLRVNTINRSASFSELKTYLTSKKDELPPYFFIMYHSYELENDGDFAFLDSTLLIAKNNQKIRFSTLSDFNDKWHAEIHEIESLKIKFFQQINKNWFGFYSVNQLMNNMSDHHFQEFNINLCLNDLTLLNRNVKNLIRISSLNFLVENSFLILLFGVVVLTINLFKVSDQKRLLIFVCFIILSLKILEIILIFIKYNQFHLYFSYIFYLTTIGVCLLIFSETITATK